MRVFVDLDGVLTDLMPYLFSCMGVSLPDNFEWPNGSSLTATYTKITGESITYEQFWNKVDSVEFWADAPLYPHAKELIQGIIETPGVSEVFLLSAPLLLPPFHSSQGKFLWVAKHFPHMLRKFYLGTAKYAVSHENSFLIDDDDNNVFLFGENSFLWPQAWNRAKHNARLSGQDKMEMCLTVLEKAANKEIAEL